MPGCPNWSHSYFFLSYPLASKIVLRQTQTVFLGYYKHCLMSTTLSLERKEAVGMDVGMIVFSSEGRGDLFNSSGMLHLNV